MNDAYEYQLSTTCRKNCGVEKDRNCEKKYPVLPSKYRHWAKIALSLARTLGWSIFPKCLDVAVHFYQMISNMSRAKLNHARAKLAH